MSSHDRRFSALSSALAATIALLGLAGCKPQATTRTVDLLIVGGAAIDPGTESIVRDAVIAVDDGVIVAVASDAKGFSANRIVDASGKFIVPAFTDMHLHWGNGTFAEGDDLVESTLARSLYYGVTRILNMGSNEASPAEIDAFRRKLSDGTWQGSRIYAVGSLLTVPGSHPTTTIFRPDLQRQIADRIAAAPPQGPIDLMPLRAITLVRTPDDVRSEVRRLAAWGANALKLTIESGPGPFGDDHPQMSEEIVRAAVQEAHASGIRVIAHISSLHELEVCLRTGVDAAGHASITGPFEEGLYRRMGQARFFYVATLDLYDGFLNWSADPGRLDEPFLRETLTQDEAASMQQSAQIFAREREYFAKQGLRPILDHVRDAHRAGAILLTGTDTGNLFTFPGYGVHEELRLLVDAGVPPMQALAAASANAAKFFREEDRWGSIRAGQDADLLILDGDPVADIANTRRIAQVIQAGVVIDRERLRTR